MFTLVLEAVDVFFTSKHNSFMFPPFFFLLLELLFEVKGRDLCHLCLYISIGAFIAISLLCIDFDMIDLVCRIFMS